MIDLSLTQEQAVAALLSLAREIEGYTEGPTAPQRVVLIREVLAQLDAALDEVVTQEEE